jgi:prepilin peptidase CpaA
MNAGLVCLFAAVAIAVLTDLRARKIPNRVVVAGLVAAVAYHLIAMPGEGVLAVSAGSIGLPATLGGLATGFALLIPLYVMRAMGAGDVKLMMMVGAYLGPFQTAGVVVLTFAAGGVLAVGMAVWQRSLARLASNLRFMLTASAARAAGGDAPRFEPLEQTAGRMPYALAIATGTLLQLALVRNGGWMLS